MTLAEVLDVMSNDELLEIVQDGQDVYTGYLALLVPERGHGYNELYERYKDAPVTKMAIKDEVKMAGAESVKAITAGADTGLSVQRITVDYIPCDIYRREQEK